MAKLTLDLALRVIDGALARGTELGCAPLTVVVLDAGGHDLALKRQDGSGILRCDIARGKAWGALGMGFSSRELAERAQKVPAFFGALASVSRGRLVPAAGGVLIYDEARNLLGAIGISGDTSDRDEDCALRGIAAAALHV
jgi:uncharacterized protein GlcG (DUF336 family)